jgi:prephenate dehydrogenase
VTIGLIGYGRFGAFAAAHLARKADLLVFDPKQPRGPFPSPRIKAAPLKDVASADVVVLAVPISALQRVLRAIVPFVRPSALVVDVCSVKMYPVRWMRALLPSSVHILATHPLFGPDSASDTLRGHHVVLCPVRLPKRYVRKTVTLLQGAGLQCTTMTPRAHDRFMAETLLLAQFVGRVVARTRTKRYPFGTRSYSSLMNLARTADNDTRELFHDMVKFNPYAVPVLRKLLRAQTGILHELRVHLHP